MGVRTMTWDANKLLGPWCQGCGDHTRSMATVKIRGKGEGEEVLYDFEVLCPVCSDKEAHGERVPTGAGVD